MQERLRVGKELKVRESKEGEQKRGGEEVRMTDKGEGKDQRGRGKGQENGRVRAGKTGEER